MSSVDGEQVVDALSSYNKELCHVCHVLWGALTCARVVIVTSWRSPYRPFYSK